MQAKEISEQFYKEIFRLSGWEYSKKAASEKSLYLRAAADKFIYQDLPLPQQNTITNKAKSSNMAIPPSLHLIIDSQPVQEETLRFLEISGRCSNISELENSLGKKSDIEEEKKDFGRLLSSFFSVPHK